MISDRLTIKTMKTTISRSINTTRAVVLSVSVFFPGSDLVVMIKNLINQKLHLLIVS